MAVYIYMIKNEKTHKNFSNFNRVVIFNTTDFTFHGVPDPLDCPENIQENHLLYYTNGRPRNEVRSILEKKSTLYKERPGEKFNYSTKYFVSQLMPPFIYSLLKTLKSLKTKPKD